jgi:NAD(P)H-hydrate epimerase
MENAGAGTVREMLHVFPAVLQSRVAVLCGRGNNGGDGFVVARHLHDRGAGVETFLLGRRDEVKGDARVNLEILEKMGLPPLEVTTVEEMATLADRVRSADIVVDALLGTGGQGPAKGLLAEAIEIVNARDARWWRWTSHRDFQR